MTRITEMYAPSDLSALAVRLASAAAEFDDHSCNDHSLAANAENKSIAISALQFIEATGNYEENWEDFASDVMDADGEIDFFDNWLMAYMAHRCQDLAAGKGGAALSKAECEVISELLNLVDELK